MSNYRDEMQEDTVIPSEPSATEGIHLDYCPDCDGHFEIIAAGNGTFLDCNCPIQSGEVYDELDFN